MPQEPYKPCACANANISLPIYGITSLSPLPAEIRNLVHSFLIAAPCKAHALIFTRLSRDHYTTIIHRLYLQIVATDQAVDAGLYKSFSNVDNQSHQSDEHRTLPSKKELLDGCESLVFTSLYAWTQTTGMLKRRFIPMHHEDMFRSLNHVAFAPGFVEEICRREAPPFNRCITPTALWYISDACIQLPESFSEDLAMNLGKVSSYLLEFGIGICGTTETVLHFHNCQPTKLAMANERVTSFVYDVMSIDIPPTRIENAVNIAARQIDEIVEYCVKSVTDWDEMNTQFSIYGPSVPFGKEIVFTNFGTVITPAGLVFVISPSIAQSVIERVESEVRRRVRLFLESELPAGCGLEAHFHVRGYDECRFCPLRRSSSG
ncbi:hypothetical protein L198_01287 [Cryptococcus wingfieldii CBS 7118]|uniref:Uncharacterized protein n=1 Tax=Cryptococcus wingfieldii CBS 7118 TaxID=1295528 RepID=A0A1E3JYV9_9TREE|nr:hypothetical protein L198_01287 [Cryptococcus wingfieldii CBS 7118]ODO06058.1 hypothetical protein L198_01287 [Cryptococcus wingfieldii CBS 7118]